MAKAAEGPASPIDDYVAPAAEAPAGGPPPPYMSPEPGYSASYGSPLVKTNVLAIIGLIASCAGVFIPGAVIAGVIMGHIALSQIKRTGEAGHGLALAAVIVGYALFALELIALVIYVIFVIVLVGAASTTHGFSSVTSG